MNDTPRTMRLLPALALTGALLIGGCGDDDSDTAEKDDTSTTAAAAEDASVEAACGAYTDISAAMSGEPEGDPAAWFKKTIVPLADELDANKPADIDAELTTMVDTVNKVAESGDMSGFEDPAFSEAQGTVDPYMFENCDFDQKVEVSGKEYSFEGLSDEMAAGETAILFTNDGMEAHEIVVASKKDGVTESFEELLELPEEEAMTKINMMGGTFAPQKGDQGLMVADLVPGEYAALCFIPTGTTMGEDGEKPGDGPPHFTQGMMTEFTVS
jgi:hypothetical protein